MAKQVAYTVIGAGNGGKAMAAHLGLKGFNVTLYNRTADRISSIKELGGIRLESFESGPHGFGQLVNVTSDLSQAITHADVIMVVVPSTALASVAAAAAPHLRDGQFVVLHPGRTLGAIEFQQVIRKSGCTAQVIVSEAETLIYNCRSEGPAEARIIRIKNAVPLAALPASKTQQVLDVLRKAFPEYVDGVDVLHTGLNNINAIIHPAIMLLNMGRIESTAGEFQFYVNGVTPSLAHVLEVLDQERVTVAAAIGVRARTALEWLRMAYNVQGENLYEAIQNQPGYVGIKAPNTLNHRYIFEDVPMSLVPIASLAHRYGVSVQGIESIIRIACVVHQTDYWRRGRSLERLGIQQMSVSELTHFVAEGVLPGS